MSRAKSGGVRTTGTCAPGPITYQPGRSKADVQWEQGGIPIVDPRRREINPNDEAETTETVKNRGAKAEEEGVLALGQLMRALKLRLKLRSLQT